MFVNYCFIVCLSGPAHTFAGAGAAVCTTCDAGEYTDADDSKRVSLSIIISWLEKYDQCFLIYLMISFKSKLILN